MTSENHNNHPPSHWLTPHRETFLGQIRSDGYAPSMMRQYERISDLLVQQVKIQALDARDLDSDTIGTLRENILSSLGRSSRSKASVCIRRFVEHLIKVDAIPRPSVPATELDILQTEFEAYLRDHRGLSESTVSASVRFLVKFMDFRFGETLGDLNAIIPDDITAFLAQRAKGAQPDRRKVPPTHLRSLFKFLFWSGRTKQNLANSIPRVAQPKASNLPRSLRSEEVQRLTDSVRAESAIGRRNHAMLLLIARLGLRGPEVISIQLEDLDWRSGELLVRGKGKLLDRMPIPADVGEAIVDYIRNGRIGESRYLFVSSRAPHLPFKDAQIVNSVLRDAFKKTGLKQPQRYVGAHVLRHSLAVDLLHRGASLGEIGDLLRHRSTATTSHYAKYDVGALRSIARAWPFQEGTR